MAVAEARPQAAPAALGTPRGSSSWLLGAAESGLRAPDWRHRVCARGPWQAWVSGTVGGRGCWNSLDALGCPSLLHDLQRYPGCPFRSGPYANTARTQPPTRCTCHDACKQRMRIKLFHPSALLPSPAPSPSAHATLGAGAEHRLIYLWLSKATCPRRRPSPSVPRRPRPRPRPPGLSLVPPASCSRSFPLPNPNKQPRPCFDTAPESPGGRHAACTCLDVGGRTRCCTRALLTAPGACVRVCTYVRTYRCGVSAVCTGRPKQYRPAWRCVLPLLSRRRRQIDDRPKPNLALFSAVPVSASLLLLWASLSSCPPPPSGRLVVWSRCLWRAQTSPRSSSRLLHHAF